MSDRIEDQVREALLVIQRAREARDSAKARKESAASEENTYRVDMDNAVISLARLLHDIPNLQKELENARVFMQTGKR